ncbi:MAG: glycosyltransferase, partial [Magnetospirillum sp.]|nr:glycosyltransferase [Magnetospirillum sp.]
TPTQGLVSELGAVNINQWIVPSILLDRDLSGTEASLGPVLILRRRALMDIGGFSVVSNYLAEDCEMGRRVARAGWGVRLSDYTVATMVDETSLRALIRHEVRWAHTVRAVRPFDHLLSVVTCALPLLMVLFALKPALWSAILLSIYLSLRLLLSHIIQRRMGFARPMKWWMVWPRECLCFLVWFTSLFSRAVLWRGQTFRLMRGGLLVPESGSSREVFSPVEAPNAAE